jgi:hypothetical protein
MLQGAPGSAAADHDTVQVAIQGESERIVTLTGIDITADRTKRPSGAVFYKPCGGPFGGRAIEVDLDANPPRIGASSSEVDGMLGSEENGRSLAQPIRFPWTVSLTDPLLLYVVATTSHCYCTWSASISWVSGSERGIIPIGGPDEGFKVIDSAGLPAYDDYVDHWRSW